MIYLAVFFDLQESGYGNTSLSTAGGNVPVNAQNILPLLDTAVRWIKEDPCFYLFPRRIRKLA